MELLLAITLTLSGALLAFAAIKTLEAWNAVRPGWKRTLNFFSLAALFAFCLLLSYIAQAIFLDPLSMSKLEVAQYRELKNAVDSCPGVARLMLECAPAVTNVSNSSLFGSLPNACWWQFKKQEKG